MSSRRLLKAAEAIREVVSMAILTELRDPRVQHVTVTGVEVSPDMREAKVLVSIMGNESQQKLTLRGLSNASGFLQSKIAKRIDTRYTPRLHFSMDDGVKKSIAVAEILQKIASERELEKLSTPSDATVGTENDDLPFGMSEANTEEEDTEASHPSVDDLIADKDSKEKESRGEIPS